MKPIKEIKEICKNVYFDYENNVFFCQLCGKATFKTKAQAVGHLSQCPKNDSVNRLPQTTASTTSTPPPYTMTLPPSKSDLLQAKASQERFSALYEKRLARIEERDAFITNELPHIQAVQQIGFLGITSQGWLTIGVVGFLAYMLGRSFCRCDVVGSPQINQKSPSPKPVSNIVSSLATRLANRGSDKLLSLLLGKIGLK
jgi:phage FluMu protein Com